MPQNPYSPFNNDLGAVATLAAATVSGASANLANGQGRGVRVTVDITAITAGSLTVEIDAYDPASGTYENLLTSAALAAAAVTVLTVYPAAVVTANVSANGNLPANWRIKWTIATGPVTATIGACILV